MAFPQGLLLVCVAVVARAGPPPLPHAPAPGPQLLPVQCERDCHVCDTMAAPKLLAVHKHCPHCECARKLVNATAPPCPSVLAAKRARFCVQGSAVDARGCPTAHCAATHLPLQRLLQHMARCPKLCPGGYQRDPVSGVPLCHCVCPLEEVAPGERWQLCAKRCAGHRFSIAFNRSAGCHECACAAHPAPPSCPAVHCLLFCPDGYELDSNGCQTCQCRSSPGCPPPPSHCQQQCGAEGRRRDPISGCVLSCDCQSAELMLPPAAVCPTVGCNADCGPHQVVQETDAAGCLSGCGCVCAPLHCPPEHQSDPMAAGVCVERVRDRFGCPTCECARRSEEARPLPGDSDIPLCPDSLPTDAQPHWLLPSASADHLCPNACPNLRLFDGERGCERCQCCPDIDAECPHLECDERLTDHWGCPTCACASQHFAPPSELVVEAE